MELSFVNNKRQINIDLAKVLAIIFMVIIHVLLEYFDDFSSGFNYVADSILGGPLSAPVFMISMGVGLAYSKNHDPKIIFKRGLNVFIIGYLLNLLTSLDVIYYNIVEGWSYEEIITNVLYGDILQFAGLALIFFSLLKRIKLNDLHILIVGLSLALITSFIPFIYSESYILTSLLGLFIPFIRYDELFMVFPLSVWFVFPSFGYWFANKLKNIVNLDRFYIIVGSISLGISLLAIGLESHYRVFMMGDFDELFYFMKFHDVLICIACCMALYALCHFIVRVLPNPVNNSIKTISNSLNITYIVHWIIVYYTSCFVYCFVDEIPTYTVYIILVLTILISIILGIFIKQKIRNKVEKNPKSTLRFLDA